MYTMKSVQKSRKLLLSEVRAVHRGARYITINRIPSRRPREAAVAPQDIKARQHAVPRSNTHFTVEMQDQMLESTLHPSSSNKEHVVFDNPPHFHPVYLRDACPCSRCVDPSSTQKTFQTTDIPPDIKALSVQEMENKDVKITWENDVPGFEDHVSVYPRAFFIANQSKASQLRDRLNHVKPLRWTKDRIKEQLRWVSYDQWMTDDEILGQALVTLQQAGLLIMRDVPESEKAVEDLARRMGPIRDSFYGRTWDVKSVPEAKNVAYTQQYLGLHMDLLYMADPPGFQFLHCLKNSCEGGESIFVDSFMAASELDETDFYRLMYANLAYHYRNAGEHYYHKHNVFETSWSNLPQDWRTLLGRQDGQRPDLTCINYSPPFQAPTHIPQNQMGKYAQILKPLRKFAEKVESPANLFEYKLKPGECVIFNNRRVLHGRRQFEAVGGERWLKGTYVDTDAFQSRMRVLLGNSIAQGSYAKQPSQFVFPEVREKALATRRKEKLMAATVESEKEIVGGLI